jgi:hypothetical protein
MKLMITTLYFKFPPKKIPVNVTSAFSDLISMISTNSLVKILITSINNVQKESDMLYSLVEKKRKRISIWNTYSTDK